MIEDWAGDLDFRKALRDERIKVHGIGNLIRGWPTGLACAV